MPQRALLGGGCLLLLAALAWLASDSPVKEDAPATPGWSIVHQTPKFKVHRSATIPAAYLIEANGRGLLLGCPEGLAETPVPVERVLLHHHHRDAVGGVQKFLDAKVPVSATRPAWKPLQASVAPEPTSPRWRLCFFCCSFFSWCFFCCHGYFVL